MSALERVLERLSGVRKGESGYRASCPCPDHGKGRGDKDPSLSVGVDDEGNVLLRCFAGCDNESIVEVLGLTMADLFEHRNGQGAGGLIPLQKQGQPINRVPLKTTPLTSSCQLRSLRALASESTAISGNRL